MCSHGHQQYGDPEALRRLNGAIDALAAPTRDESAVIHAEIAARDALADGNPLARTLARGVLMAVELIHAGRRAEADELITGELTRALPA